MRALIAILCCAVLSACDCGDGSGNSGGGSGGSGGAAGGGSGGSSGSGGGGPLTGLTNIAISPANQTLTITNGVAVTSAYTATGTYSDGHMADISTLVLFSLTNAQLGTFTGATFTSSTTQGGASEVRAVAGGVTGSTNLNVLFKAKINDPGSQNLPPDPSTLFGGTAGGNAPELVYPNDGTLFPPNLGHLEVHFMPGGNNTLFELAFTNTVTDVRVYLRCTNPTNGGCIYQPDQTVWSYIAESNRGGDPVVLTVRGTDDAGTQVATSATSSISFSQDDLHGGLYYWKTAPTTGIMRWDFASTTQTTPDQFIGTEYGCVGCHALSRAGDKLVAEAGGQGDGRLLLMNVASQMPIVPFPTATKSIFESWDPEGGKFVGVFGDGAQDFNLILFDGATGSALATPDIAGTGDSTHPADHPDWSNDGKKIVYTKVGTPQTMQRMWNGSISMVSTGDNGATWSAPVELAAPVTDHNRYYPTFAPDDSFVMFDESTCDTPGTRDMTCDADTDASAKLYGVLAQPGNTPVEFAKANTPGIMDNGQTKLANTFPKWSPFVFQRSAELGSRLMWITFSSTRQYGLRKPPAGTGDESPNSGTLIWMVGIDPDKMGAGTDPSFSAFCLPFQDITSSNHIAQWTTQVVPPLM